MIVSSFEYSSTTTIVESDLLDAFVVFVCLEIVSSDGTKTLRETKQSVIFSRDYLLL